LASLCCPLAAFTLAAPTATYTLSLHDALPIFGAHGAPLRFAPRQPRSRDDAAPDVRSAVALRHRAPPSRLVAVRRRESSTFAVRSEEHTSELPSHLNLVSPLLLSKEKR